MKAGRELDVLVAEKVFGATVENPNQKYGWRIDYRATDNKFNDAIYGDVCVYDWQLKRYSTDIKAAWDVVERLLDEGWKVETVSSPCGGSVVTVTCLADSRGRYYSDLMEGNKFTLPEAICIVALKVVG